MSLVFREIDPKNRDELWAFNLCHEYSLRDSFSGYVPDSQEQREKKVKRIEDAFSGGQQLFLCLAVFDGSEIVAGIFQHRMEIDYQMACHIHGLWVHPGYRKQGIGRKLKEAGEIWAKKMGCKFMDTNVRVINEPMKALNEALDYRVARYNYRKDL